MHYRRDRFIAGLKAAGFQVCQTLPDPGPSDVLLIWNRYGQYDDEARRFEAAGAMVLVAENSPLVGAVDGKWHALARSYHNDAGTVRDDGPGRWARLGVNFTPWRADGGHVLVCANRSFGTPGRITPGDWAETTAKRLRTLTKREVRIRPHPGNKPPEKPLAGDLAGAWACVIWASSAGVHSLLAGVPVICEAPFWIAKGAAGRDLTQIESPPMSDRLPSMQRLAWAVWSVEEIESGAAFRHLLQ